MSSVFDVRTLELTINDNFTKHLNLTFYNNSGINKSKTTQTKKKNKYIL